ncbi:MAG TPA: TonB-dependent receptor [Candidatus Acidoferrales bacterium]|jgi:hypothetical protein|nr:TonB-dependent receptor [Candidatus Acidoferrales bacterium]
MRLKVAVLVAITVVSLAGALQAQSPNATVTGRVTDPSGSVVPNAAVDVINTATGIRYRGKANDTGSYNVPDILPGSYRIEVEARGFRTIIEPGIVLHVQDVVEMNFQMDIGTAIESVTVQAEAPTVQLATSSISAVVDSVTVLELPLNGRDWTQLATLQSGVNSVSSLQANVTSAAGTIAERGNRGFGDQLAISGARPQENSYRLDGININDYQNGGPGSVIGAALGVDAVQEFSLLTSNYSAEYGRTSGGVITAISRSGTNQLHGDVYEFLRNSALDARNFFDGPTIPGFRRNQFGGSLGGPIKKDRTFFFVDYEGLRQSLGSTEVDTVPSAAARTGLLHNPDGTTLTVPVNPLIMPFLPLWPLPNGPLLGFGDTGLFSVADNQVINENFVTARVDHKISEKDNLFGSMEYDKAVLTLPAVFDDFLTGAITRRVFVALQETHVFSPQLLNSVRFGFNRNLALNSLGITAINPLSADLSLAAVPGETAPIIAFPGVTGFPGGTKSQSLTDLVLNSFQGYDDLLFSKGIQNLKFGFAVERVQENFFGPSFPGGEFKFGSLADFLTNQPLTFEASFPGTITPRDLRQDIVGGYIQDDIHLRSNLTVNLGLRYEMSTEPTAINNELASLRNITDTLPHLGDPLFLNPTHRNFEPRVGLAWDPFRDGKTSVRAGFGMFDVLPLIYEYMLREGTTAPFSLQGSSANLAPGSFPSGAFADISLASLFRYVHIQFNPKRNYVMQWNLNLQRQITPTLLATVAYVGSRSEHLPFHVDGGNLVLPTLTPAGYLWPFPAGSGTIVNPNIGRMDYMDWSSSAFYDALEAGITKRMSHGFQAQASYTWSKSIDTSSASMISDPFANSITSLFWFNPKLRRGLSDFNIGQNLTINYTWTIPTPNSFHGPAAWALGGWQLGGILQVESGLPFTPLIGGDPLGLDSTDPFAYPNRLKGPGCQSAVNPGNVNNYIKLQCFALPVSTPAIAAECTPFQPGGPGNPVAVGTCANLLGNSARNSLVGPGLASLDFSLFKNNRIPRISETFNLQFRAELFNVFNHANFAAPVANSTIFDQTGALVPGVGMINGTTTTAREIQFGLKAIW